MAIELPACLRADARRRGGRHAAPLLRSAADGEAYTGALWDGVDPSGRRRGRRPVHGDGSVSLALLSERLPRRAAQALPAGRPRRWLVAADLEQG